MSIVTLVGAVLGLSIFLAVLTEGMVVTGADIRYLFSRPARLVRTVLAMNVLGPVVVVTVCQLFSLHPAVIVALVTLSIAPVGALFPQGMLQLVAPGHGAYAHGLLFGTSLLSVVLTPLAVEVINLTFGGEIHVNPLTVAEVAVGSLLLPLGLGLAIARWWPEARRFVPAIRKVSSLLLFVCLIVFAVLTWSRMSSLLPGGALAALVVITLVGLTIGHFLGGPDEDDRTVLAFATVSRHPGVAIAVASLTDEPLAPVGVLLAVLVNEVATVPYKMWRKRLLAVGSTDVTKPMQRG